MNSSATLGELAKALSAVQGQLAPAKKDSQNPFFKSTYADLSSVWDSCRALLAKNNLAVSQTNKPSKDGVTVETVLLHSSGEWLSGSLFLPFTKADAQGVGSAMTYGRRYGLAAILGIVADEDDDGNRASQSKRQNVKPLEKSSEPKMWNKMLAQQHEAIMKLAEVKGVDAADTAMDIGNKFLAEMNEAEAGAFIKTLSAL